MLFTWLSISLLFIFLVFIVKLLLIILRNKITPNFGCINSDVSIEKVNFNTYRSLES